jgi:hypothetical protein
MARNNHLDDLLDIFFMLLKFIFRGIFFVACGWVFFAIGLFLNLSKWCFYAGHNIDFRIDFEERKSEIFLKKVGFNVPKVHRKPIKNPKNKEQFLPNGQLKSSDF